MKWKRLIVIAIVLLLLSSPILFRKYRVPLVSNGKTVAVATRPFIFPFLGKGECNVYAGNTRAFSLWTDSFDSAIFIYPFADGKRFLCDYDYDTAILVFVVDFNVQGTNSSTFAGWPSDPYLRTELIDGATNVVTNTKGLVRLPNYEELQEVSAYIADSQFKTHSLPVLDLGLYRFYPRADILLADLTTNRNSAWP
jgi:hypothetical protein